MAEGRDQDDRGLYLVERSSGEPLLVNRSLHGGRAQGLVSHIQVSSDGEQVAFTSSASDLVEGASHGRSEVYLFRRRSDVVERLTHTGDEGLIGGLFLADSGERLYFHQVRGGLTAKFSVYELTL